VNERAFGNAPNDGHQNGVECVMIIDTNRIQTHAELPDISSQHNRDAVQHEPSARHCRQLQPGSQHGKCCLSTNDGRLWTDLRQGARLHSWSKVHDGTNITQGTMAYQFNL